MPDNLTRQILREPLVSGDLRLGSPISIRVDQARSRTPPARWR
jgi:hypothetical protein